MLTFLFNLPILLIQHKGSNVPPGVEEFHESIPPKNKDIKLTAACLSSLAMPNDLGFIALSSCLFISLHSIWL